MQIENQISDCDSLVHAKFSEDSLLSFSPGIKTFGILVEINILAFVETGTSGGIGGQDHVHVIWYFYSTDKSMS